MDNWDAELRRQNYSNMQTIGAAKRVAFNKGLFVGVGICLFVVFMLELA